ncbi:MAG TPA: peptidase E [Gaiellaceae bacterium]|nr:peptidase E [Gaiellaceae bacterium]
MEKQIFAIGGGRSPEAVREYMLRLTGKERPKVLLVPTAGAEDADAILRWYDWLGPRAEPSHAAFFPWPRDDLREHALSRDLIVVGGGNTANALAIWRVHGFDDVLREAYERGIVLAGSSAGMICWFEAGVTDSFGPQLEGMRDGLGVLSGSACPHYDDEELRRPMYRRLIDEEGFPPGVAADAGVGLHFVDGELAEVVSAHEGTTGYRVEPGSERALPAALLL